MRITPTQVRMATIAGGSAVLAAGATVAWAGASGTSSWRERFAGVGYAPGVLGMGAAALSAPALLVPAARPIAKAVAAAGIAAAAGMAVGTAAARLLGASPPAAVMHDDQLPPVDEARAAAEAEETWQAIDRTRGDIVIWVPGTMRTQVPGAFADGIGTAFGRDVSLVKLPTHPNYQVPQGVADSAAALRELIPRLDAARADGQRILLAGESQGAWALAVAMQDPAVAAAVDRAVVWGNPGVSPHQFDGAGDGRVLELSDELDVVGRELDGDAQMVLDGATRTFDGEWWNAWRMAGTMLNNPHEASLIARSGLRLLTPDGYGRDPHNHREFMGAAARFLADAPRPVE